MDHEEAELVAVAEALLSAMYRNGQLVGETVSGWYDGTFAALVYASHRDAFHPRNHSKWVAEALTEARSQFGADPVFEILDDNVSWPVPGLKSASSLFLYCDGIRSRSPVRHGNRGTALALPLLSLPQVLRDEICDWQTAYVNHDRIWFGGGPLEIAAYHQLADPFSDLMTYGRDLAADIEDAVAIPVYTYILRHWGHCDDVTRLCPGCGNEWLTEESPIPSREPFHRFHFQCNPCRLVSHLATVIDDPEMAAVGTFDEARRIEPKKFPVTPGVDQIDSAEDNPKEASAT